MKLRLLCAMLLAVGVLTAAGPTRDSVDKPPMPVGGWEAFRARVVYPEMAEKAQMEGEVLIYAYIDEGGQVTDLEVVRGAWETGFVDAACEAIRGTRFRPGKRQSTPVGMWLAIRVVFTIYG